MQEMEETPVQSMGQEDPLEEGMATHFSIPAWRIPWTEEPGGLSHIQRNRAEVFLFLPDDYPTPHLDYIISYLLLVP